MKNDGRFKPFTQEQFLLKAKEKHGSRYNYSKSVYVNGKTKIIIGCDVHGDFTQEARKHLTGSGCKKCLYDSMSMNTEVFINKSLATHNNTYDYSLSLCKKSTDIVSIICSKHGVFQQQASLHAAGAGCQRCASDLLILKQSDVLSRLRKIHGDRYIYDDFVYKKGMIKTKIKCRVHGVFYQYPRSHLMGYGCPKCHNGSYTETGFKKLCLSKNGAGIIYLIKCEKRNESFYKIGITSNSTQERFNNKVLMPYRFRVVSEITGEPGYIWRSEKILNKSVSDVSYKPKLPFHGSSRECFSSLTKEVMDFFGVSYDPIA